MVKEAFLKACVGGIVADWLLSLGQPVSLVVCLVRPEHVPRIFAALLPAGWALEPFAGQNFWPRPEIIR